MQRLSIGDLIADNFGREGLVFAKERRPSARWLAEQDDERVRQSTGPWWKVLPLSGGAVIVAEDLATFIRRASIDDLYCLMKAQQSEHGGAATLIDLIKRLNP